MSSEKPLGIWRQIFNRSLTCRETKSTYEQFMQLPVWHQLLTYALVVGVLAALWFFK